MHICVSCLPCCAVTVIMRSCQHWNSFHWVKKQFRERKWGDITRLAGGKKVLAAIKKMNTVRVTKLFCLFFLIISLFLNQCKQNITIHKASFILSLHRYIMNKMSLFCLARGNSVFKFISLMTKKKNE